MNDHVPAFWLLLCVGLFVLLFDVGAIVEGRPTISNLCQWLSGKYHWLRWIAIPVWMWLYYHLFWELRQ